MFSHRGLLPSNDVLYFNTGATEIAEVLMEDNRTLENLWLADSGLSFEGGRVMAQVSRIFPHAVKVQAINAHEKCVIRWLLRIQPSRRSLYTKRLCKCIG